MLVLVTYDVSTQDNAGKRRLHQVAKRCEQYGQRVQNSVFECLLQPDELVLLKHQLLKSWIRNKTAFASIIWVQNINRRLTIMVQSILMIRRRS